MDIRNLVIISEEQARVTMRGADGYDDNAPVFGRIDPFCWVAVVPMALLAVGLIVIGGVLVGVCVVLITVALAVFDSWVNRPRPGLERDPRQSQMRPSSRGYRGSPQGNSGYGDRASGERGYSDREYRGSPDRGYRRGPAGSRGAGMR